MVALSYPLPRVYPVTRRYGDLSLAQFGPHTGIDLGAPHSTAVLAPAAGTARTFWNVGGGRMVAIAHGAGVETRFAHLAFASVRNGQLVATGQQIGAVGATGAAVIGAHLHYEVWSGGQHIDPAPYLGGGAVPATLANDQKPQRIEVAPGAACPAGYVKDPSGPNRCISQEAVLDPGEAIGGALGLVLPPLLEPALNLAVIAGGVVLVWRGVMTIIRP